MMYKEKFHSTFYDRDNNKVSIHIYKNVEESENIVSQELTLSSNAVTITYQSDEIFQPLKQSGCTISVLTDSILTDLYTGKINDVMVKIYKNEELFWMGFLTPNLYSSEYQTSLDLLQLEFIDVVSNLENIKYSSSGNGVNSFYNIITDALSKIDEGHIINSIYLHKSLSIDDDQDILNSLYIQERNFYDEGKEPQTCKSVIEDILRYLGMSLIQYKDSYILLDYESLKKGYYDFIKYDLIENTISSASFQEDKRTISEIGIYNNQATISMGDIYNQISIVANNNPINDLLPDLFDDLVNQNEDPNKYYNLDDTPGIMDEELTDNTYLVAFFNSEKWENFGAWHNEQQFKELTPDNIISSNGIYKGTYYQKMAQYKKEDGEPSTLNWKDYLTMLSITPYPDTPSFWIEKENQVFKGGYFIVDMRYMLSRSPFAMVENQYYIEGESPKRVVFEGVFSDCKFPVQLQIGEYYYNGKDWQKEECKFYLCRKNKEGEDVFYTEYNLTNQVSYTENLIDSGDGVLIALPSNMILQGTLKFKVYSLENLGGGFTQKGGTFTPPESVVRCCHISDFKFVYTTKNTSIDVFNPENNEPDVLYTNDIDSDNITEFEDINLRVNTYSPKAVSYSYVIKNTTSGYDFVDLLSKKEYEEQKKMEEFIIEKYYNQYSIPRIKYSNMLHNRDLKPYTAIVSTSLNKTLYINSLIYNLTDNSVEANLIEL
ncbi:hypothetical protein [uncultured Bacteroides sp.]|uniref:hypothetical protein n=1 Tax=uncultured Bacteroides sp. TaxID=162156 RepID=UPI0026271A42|nr:hypothetical protein [uncultured Bacteroides sp.]